MEEARDGITVSEGNLVYGPALDAGMVVQLHDWIHAYGGVSVRRRPDHAHLGLVPVTRNLPWRDSP